MQTYLPGTEVIARGLRWEIVTTDQLGAQTLYRLRGLSGATRGRELDLLWPFEKIEPVQHELAPDRAAPLMNWLVYHRAFILEQALGPGALLAVQPGRLRVEPYQLVPLLRALHMSRVRLLLADGVGLGKTIQAGLILTELLARRLAHRILVVSPAGPLLSQWHDELSDRFGLRLDVVDRGKIEDVRRSEELGANPFDRLPLALASPDFLKQERILEQLERATYDVIVMDEAHHYMDLGALGEREDTQRRRLAETLARRCDALLLLTATPHDGNDRSFASLCELLDPSLVGDAGGLRGERYRGHIVRRLKRHITDPETGAPKFRERQVIPCPVKASEAEHPVFVEMQRKLVELVAPQLRRAFHNRQYSEVLSFISLLKRSVSTARACGRTLAVVGERYQAAVTQGAEEQEARKQRLRTLREYQRRLERFGALTTEEEEDRAVLEAEDLAQLLAGLQREQRTGSARLARAVNVTEALDELAELAQEAEAEAQDPKLGSLVDAIRQIRAEEPDANVLVYTEYVDSQVAAVQALRAAGFQGILTISGNRPEEEGERGNTRQDRRLATDRFQTEEGLILVSTDAAAEGLNLHQRCHNLIHLELPFNPNRLEQRNGRIDRYGQTFDPVVRYFYLRGTFEERILFRLIAKYEQQRKRLTFVPNTLGVTTDTDAAAQRLLKPLLDEDKRLFQDQGALFTVEEAAAQPGEEDASRELLEEIDRSMRGYEQAARSATWLGEAGLNADASLSQEADQARTVGERANATDLLAFVRDAVSLDGGSCRQVEPDVLELSLPAAWLFGLDDLPGYDPDAHVLLLTTSQERLRDGRGRPVGYLGRGHAIVRRALDRVRNLSFGSAGQERQDPRASAVRADVGQPELLCTFLGRVSSGAGREFERVLAVRMSRAGAVEVYEEPAAWAALTDPQRGIRTTDLWKKHFEAWGPAWQEQSREAVAAQFAGIAGQFTEERRRDLGREQEDLRRWLEQRESEITRQVPAPEAQLTLGENSAERLVPSWRKASTPEERLAGLAQDRGQPPRIRAEAETALTLYRERAADLGARLAMREPEIVPLGLLMLIPEAHCAA